MTCCIRAPPLSFHGQGIWKAIKRSFRTLKPSISSTLFKVEFIIFPTNPIDKTGNCFKYIMKNYSQCLSIRQSNRLSSSFEPKVKQGTTMTCTNTSCKTGHPYNFEYGELFQMYKKPTMQPPFTNPTAKRVEDAIMNYKLRKILAIIHRGSTKLITLHAWKCSHSTRRRNKWFDLHTRKERQSLNGS